MFALLLFSAYTVSIKFIYADDFTLEYQHKDLINTKTTLTDDVIALEDYFRAWKLHSNPLNTEVVWFHLNNRLASYKLGIVFTGFKLKHKEHSQHLWTNLNRSLIYKSHLNKSAAKIKTRVNIVHFLNDTPWWALSWEEVENISRFHRSHYILIIMILLGWKAPGHSSSPWLFEDLGYQ